MKQLFYIFLLLQFSLAVSGQYNYPAILKDSATGEPLENVSVFVRSTGKGTFSDANGNLLLRNIPAGKQELIFSMTGYKSFSLQLQFPLSSASVATITMSPESKELEKVIISSSRTDSRIENTPTRVEVLGSEEVDEEGGVKPAHVASLLGDVAGIQSQQTSAVTGNTDLRIQGLPGDYTQLLKDGMPLFGGYAGGFSILQIPPLDLKQIEIIKGASSTLYGGGAIAGMINIISRTPQLNKQERFLLLNQSTLKETNIDIFLSDRDKKWGYTFFAAGNYQKSVDVNNDGFSDLPLTESVQLHPRFFLYPNEKNVIALGITTQFEERKGGDMLVLRNFRDSQHQFYILNRSYRNTLDLTWDDHISNKDKLSVKGTASWYYRNIGTNTFGMKGKQLAYYTEVSYLKKLARHDLVAGLNFNGEKFKKLLPDSTLIDNYNFFTVGLFVQDDWRLHRRVTLESGLRTDIHNEFGTFVLPRISLLFKLTNALTTRLGGGLGYKIPTIFHSEIDERDYRHLSFDKNPPVKAERSAGVNWDVNFKKKLGEVDLTINQSFYYTEINDPLVAVQQSGGIVYHTESKPIVTKGFETWIQIAYKGLEAYLGYTLTNTRKNYDPVQPFLELSARNKFASVISYEFSRRFRACIEAAYTGTQWLDNGTQTPSFPFVAGMVRYDIGRFSFVLNCENLLDYRQTKKESIVIPPLTNPRFKQIWAPIDGRVVNLSMKINL